MTTSRILFIIVVGVFLFWALLANWFVWIEAARQPEISLLALWFMRSLIGFLTVMVGWLIWRSEA